MSSNIFQKDIERKREDISTLDLCVKSIDILMNLVEDVSKKDGSERSILLDLRNRIIQVKEHISGRPLMVEFGKVQEPIISVEDNLSNIDYQLEELCGILSYGFTDTLVSLKAIARALERMEDKLS